MLRLGIIALAGVVIVGLAFVYFLTSGLPGAREAAQRQAVQVLDSITPGTGWRVRGSWWRFHDRRGYDVSLQPVNDPLLVVSFTLKARENCARGSECHASARAALSEAEKRRPEHARIIDVFQHCGLPVLAIHRMRYLPGTGDQRPRLEGWIDLELSFEREYRHQRRRLDACIHHWRQARETDPAIVWQYAAPAVTFRILPEGDRLPHVLLNGLEVADQAGRYGRPHYAMTIHRGRLGELRIAPSSGDFTDLRDRIAQAIIPLIAADARLSGASVVRLEGGLSVSRDNADILWAHYLLCRGTPIAQGCRNSPQTVRVRYNRSTGRADALVLQPKNYNAMLFSEDELSEMNQPLANSSSPLGDGDN